MAKSKSKKLWGKRISKFLLVLWLGSSAYLLLCKWVFPPITITQNAAVISGDGLKREFVSWDKISKNVKLAVIASEDQLFLQHRGFDWRAIQKSINTNNGTSKNRIAGAAASTISQQTAKNVFLWQGKGWTKYLRKVFEFYFTAAIELCWSKKRILEIYLNEVEMGKGVFGIEAAANYYFHKSASKLSAEEAAMIIASLPNPKKFTVVPRSKRVSWRYPQILRQMKNIDSDKAVINFLE